MNKADNLPMSTEEASKEYVSDINCHSYNEHINDTIKAFSRDAFEQGAKWYEENVLSHHINVLAERIADNAEAFDALNPEYPKESDVKYISIVSRGSVLKIAKDYINELNLNK